MTSVCSILRSQTPSASFSSCKRFMSMTVHVHPSQARAEMLRPGWDFKDFTIESDLQPYQKVWQLLPMIDWSREFSFNAGVIDQRVLEKTHLTYIKCIDLKRSVAYEDFVGKGLKPFEYDFKVTSALAKVGRTSFQLDHQCLHAPSNKPIFTSSIVFVCVDRVSRQVSPIPDWWVTKYKDLSTDTQSPLRVAFRDAGPGSLPSEHLRIRVLPSHIDYYRHTNNSSYFYYAQDSILNALNKGRVLTVLKQRRAVENAIKNIQVDFISDSNEGDELDAVTWQDAHDDHTLWTQILLAGQTVYFQKVTIDPSSV